MISGIKSPDCIAYDWISDLIYWSDGKADTIEVSNIFLLSNFVVMIDGTMGGGGGGVLDPKKKTKKPMPIYRFWCSDWFFWVFLGEHPQQ